MPFEPDPRPNDTPITVGEFNQKGAGLWKAGAAEAKAAANASHAPIAEELKTVRAKLATMPDASKLEARLQKAEAKAAEWQEKYTASTTEYSTEKALLVAGITEEDDQAYVRWKFERSDEDDFAKFASGIKAADTRYFGEAAAPPPPADPNAPTPPPPTPNVNAGTQPAPPAGATHDIHWYRKQSKEWKNDPGNRAEINGILGSPAGFGIHAKPGDS
jgi:hypothetical protein